VTSAGTIAGTQSNQIELTGGQGFLSLQYNAGQGGGAIGLADNVTQFTLASGQAQSGGTDTGRIYLGSDSSGQMRVCYRTGGADTCNLTFKADGTFTGWVMKASSGQFQGASVLDLYANGANRWEIGGSGHAYPYVNNTYDIGVAGFLPRTITAATSVVAA
jgi:hypothetical protein